MRPQIEIKRKALEAQFTLEWLLTRMYKLMSLKLRVVKETLTAAVNRADVLSLTVCHQVLSQR